MGNVSGDQGMIRRFMNLIGSPNFISGLHMCEGNTLQVHRATFGTSIAEDLSSANCILLVGHNPHRGNWAASGAAGYSLARGAKLIVLDPRNRKTPGGRSIHLPLRYGTDTAMLLGFFARDCGGRTIRQRVCGPLYLWFFHS